MTQQDAPDCVVDPRLGNLALVHQLLEQRDELDVAVLLARAVGDHDHVDAGVDRDLDGRLVVVRELVDGRPVGDDESLEPQLLLEHLGEQMVIAVHLLAVPAAVRGHDRADAGLDGSDVTGQVNLPKRGLVALGVALVNAAGRSAVAQVVLGAGEGRGRGSEAGPLEPADRRGTQDFGSSGFSPKLS